MTNPVKDAAARGRVYLPHVRHGVLNVFKNRSDFLKAASARRYATGSFLLQARDRRDGEEMVRIGFTASKKVGNAVERALAKRRLRAIARELLPKDGKAGWDYVLVAKPNASTSRDYQLMLEDLTQALSAVQRPPKPRPPKVAPLEIPTEEAKA